MGITFLFREIFIDGEVVLQTRFNGNFLEKFWECIERKWIDSYPSFLKRLNRFTVVIICLIFQNY